LAALQDWFAWRICFGVIAVPGTVTQFQTLFNTHLNNYRSPKGDEFYSAESKPLVPAAIASRLMGVVGLTNSRQFAPQARPYKKFGETPAAKPVTDTGGTGAGGAFSPGDIQSLCATLNSTGYSVKQTIALFETGLRP
jgi:subtilase family serine protease